MRKLKPSWMFVVTAALCPPILVLLSPRWEWDAWAQSGYCSNVVNDCTNWGDPGFSPVCEAVDYWATTVSRPCLSTTKEMPEAVVRWDVGCQNQEKGCTNVNMASWWRAVTLNGGGDGSFPITWTIQELQVSTGGYDPSLTCFDSEKCCATMDPQPPDCTTAVNQCTHDLIVNFGPISTGSYSFSGDECDDAEEQGVLPASRFKWSFVVECPSQSVGVTGPAPYDTRVVNQALSMTCPCPETRVEAWFTVRITNKRAMIRDCDGSTPRDGDYGIGFHDAYVIADLLSDKITIP